MFNWVKKFVIGCKKKNAHTDIGIQKNQFVVLDFTCHICNKKCNKSETNLVEYIHNGNVVEQRYCTHCAREEWYRVREAYKNICIHKYDSPFLCRADKKCTDAQKQKCANDIKKYKEI